MHGSYVTWTCQVLLSELFFLVWCPRIVGGFWGRIVKFIIFPKNLVIQSKTSWWFQPNWKICSSNRIISPGWVEHNIYSNHHPEKHVKMNTTQPSRTSWETSRVRFSGADSSTLPPARNMFSWKILMALKILFSGWQLTRYATNRSVRPLGCQFGIFWKSEADSTHWEIFWNLRLQGSLYCHTKCHWTVATFRVHPFDCWGISIFGIVSA